MLNANAKTGDIQASLWNTKNLPNLPRFLRFFIDSARNKLHLDKLILFGSRARGDNTPYSDYDLCLVLISQSGWAEFYIDQQENADTLCKLDLMVFDDLDAKLQQEILKSGVVLYEAT